MTLLAVSIFVDTVESLAERAHRAWAGGAEAVEIRLDSFRESAQHLGAYLASRGDRTWILTCRSRAEGGWSPATAAERAEFLACAVPAAGAYIDFEYADWKRCPDSRRQLSALAGSGPGNSRLILSAHDVHGRPEKPEALAREMLAVKQARAVKIAYKANHICDTFDALDLLRQHGSRIVVTAISEDGLWTRILAKKFSAFATYCSLGGAVGATAPGQVPLSEMVNRYRWPALDAGSTVYGVIGDPVAHSVSPVLFSRWFAEHDVNAVYVPLLVRRKGDCMRRFLDHCRQRPWLNLAGLSVTLPHKSSVLHWAGDDADWMPRRIGALNTLVFDNSRATGFNTDCYAAIDSLSAALGCRRTELDGLTVDVLGTGGAARAVVYGLPMYGCRVTVYGRSLDRAKRLADAFNAVAKPWDDRVHATGRVLVNCTSVGMWPGVEQSPMPEDALGGRRLVFDLVYNPLTTRLLHDAARAGAATLNGLDMFVRQAAMQFQLWTGHTANLQAARQVVENEIQARGEAPS